VWFATELVKFDSYGAAPGAMPRLVSRPASPLGPKRFRRRLDPCHGVLSELFGQASMESPS
jgi:hypothetical protein